MAARTTEGRISFCHQIKQADQGGLRSQIDRESAVSPCGHRARIKSLSAETVVAGSYLVGPMSVPSNSRNLTSIGSFPPAISRPVHAAHPAPSNPPKIQGTADQKSMAKKGSHGIYRNRLGVGFWRRILASVWGLKARGRRLGEEERGQVEKTRDPAVVGSGYFN